MVSTGEKPHVVAASVPAYVNQASGISQAAAVLSVLHLAGGSDKSVTALDVVKARNDRKRAAETCATEGMFQAAGAVAVASFGAKIRSATSASSFQCRTVPVSGGGRVVRAQNNTPGGRQQAAAQQVLEQQRLALPASLVRARRVVCSLLRQLLY